MTDLCSVTSGLREEPLTATASRVERWLLVEHRGAWGPESVPSGRMPRTLSRHLADVAARARARLLLVRRPAGVAPSTGRQVFAVDSRPGHEQIRQVHVAADDELLGLSYDGTEWQPYAGPLYLVCTHGRHDRCCALRGRPVAQALSHAHPERTWESSHVGGDRFSANLVVLPEGHYVGRVAAEAVVAMVADLSGGRLPAGQVRGRSSLPLPTQAAQHFAREALSAWGTGDLVPLAIDVAGQDTWRVRLARPDVEVVVTYDRAAGGVHQLTCDAIEAKPVPAFALVSLTQR